MRRLLLAFLVLLVPALANAGTQTRSRLLTASGSSTLLNAVAANATAATRTVTAFTGGYNQLSWTVSLTRSAGTQITMTCTASTDGGVTYGDINTVSVGTGTATLTPATWSYGGATGTLAANAATNIDMAVGTYDAIKCIFGATSGGASDFLTVTGIVGSP